jgi:membrane protein
MRSLLSFLLRVVSGFRRNQGLLLSGAVAYYTLLSIVPLFVLLLVGLSHVADQQRLLDTVESNLDLLIPGQAPVITGQVESFLAHRRVVGVVGLLALLFFSTMAFTILENAMSLIFHHRARVGRRHFLVSAILPYLFITLIGLGLLLITVISAALEAVGRESIRVLGYVWPLAGASGALLYALGVVGLVSLLTAFYMVLPVGGISFRHAVIGAATATLLWELTRHVLVWYFATLSMVNLIYGSLAATIVVLLTLEGGAVIVLLGAQVIAELERERRPLGPAALMETDVATPRITPPPPGSPRESPPRPPAPPPGWSVP